MDSKVAQGGWTITPAMSVPSTTPILDFNGSPDQDVLHGHWDIKESELNKPHFTHDRARGVNMGIVVVVPASKILDIIARPELVAIRAMTDKAIMSIRMPGPHNV